jgi:hypothetical protein
MGHPSPVSVLVLTVGGVLGRLVVVVLPPPLFPPDVVLVLPPGRVVVVVVLVSGANRTALS